jgi:L-alanine-DL-glutamate epimerase-like enolase superfamily enzyme
MDAAIRKLEISAYTVPTESPESDGTHAWNSTTMVLVELHAGGAAGLGYSYTHRAAAVLIADLLPEVLVGADATAIPALRRRVLERMRNLGQTSVVSAAVSAVDTALWDLKARLLGIPLVDLFGAVWESVPVYGSGGFTSFSPEQLARQLGGWVEEGISRVKMKVGRSPAEDGERVRAAREAIGPKVELFVDANGAYDRRQAIAKAQAFQEHNVTWFEEPVDSLDLEGLRLVRDRSPAAMEITTGEYGWDLTYFRDLLAADAIDVLQADATRCGGFTGFLDAATLCDAHKLPLSAHTAPALHLPAACAARPLRHIEWFADHVRIERMFFDGFPEPDGGAVRPDRSRSGLGLELKQPDAEPYLVWRS